jgi:ATP-dependent Clp protease ATP-binding subunit ClpB
MQLEIERAALKKETDDASRERLARLEKELAETKASSAGIQARWQAEKASVGECVNCVLKSSRHKQEIEKAERSYDLNRVAELSMASSPHSNAISKPKGCHRGEQGSRLIKEEVDEEDIAEVVSRWTVCRRAAARGRSAKAAALEEVLTEGLWGRTKPSARWRRRCLERGRD